MQMTEDDIRYILESTEIYPVDHNIFVKFITSSKKISIKKVIEQNELIEVKDYIISFNNEYSFTLNAFKQCMGYYKCKFFKLFITIEEAIKNEKYTYYINKISELEEQIMDMKHDPTYENNIKIETSNNISQLEYQLDIESLSKKIDTLSKKLDTIPDFNSLSKKLDTIPDFNSLSKKLDHHSKKIKSINIS